MQRFTSALLRCPCLSLIALLLLSCGGPTFPSRPLEYRYILTELDPSAQRSAMTFRGPYMAFINRYGEILGSVDRSYGLWIPRSPNGTAGDFVDFTSVIPPAAYVTLDALNDYGQVAGEFSQGDMLQAFLWTPAVPHGANGTMTLLQTRRNATDLFGIVGLNDYGQVLLANDATALWTPTQANGTQGTLMKTPLATGAAHWLNDAGQVGITMSVSQENQHLWVWTPEQPHGTSGTLTYLSNVNPG